MKRITRTQAIEELTEETLQYYLEHAEMELRNFIQFGTIGFEDLSNEELADEYMEVFGEEVEIANVKVFKSTVSLAQYVYDEYTFKEFMELLDNIRLGATEGTMLEKLVSYHGSVNRLGKNYYELKIED